MKIITTTLYEYRELSDEARKRAYEDWLRKGHGHWHYVEIDDTLEELSKEFSIDVNGYSYDDTSHDTGRIVWNGWNDDALNLSGRRAQAFLWNNFGHLILQPSHHYYLKVDGKWRNCVGQKSRQYESKVFFDREYDGTCPLTGVCFDCDALDPLAYFCFGVKWDEKTKKRVMIPQSERSRWNKTTVKDVIHDCVDSLLEAAQKDYEYQRSEESFEDFCLDNDVMFDRFGRIRSDYE